MKPIVYMVCGVPGVGKTWVCEQLDGGKMIYIRNDDYIGNRTAYLERIRQLNNDGVGANVVTDCPFGERETKLQLTDMGLTVKPYFIVETPEVVGERYERREGKPASQATLTRATTIKKRADEWNAPQGTAAEVLAMLKAVG